MHPKPLWLQTCYLDVCCEAPSFLEYAFQNDVYSHKTSCDIRTKRAVLQSIQIAAMDHLHGYSLYLTPIDWVKGPTIKDVNYKVDYYSHV